MPALVVCNRRWHVAADDVPLVAAPAAMFHLVWCAVLGAGLWLLRRPAGCQQEGEQLLALLRGLIACFAAAAVLELAMAAEGLKGG